MKKNQKCLIGAMLLLVAMTVQGQTLLDNQFDYPSEFENYTVIDHNEDSQTWEYDDLFYAVSCSRDFDADDWFITPSLNLVEGKTYQLTFVTSLDAAGNETFAVKMGTSASVAGLTTELLAPFEITSDSRTTYTATFTATTTGSHFIGFHYATTGDFYSNRIYLHSIQLSETSNQSVPSSVSQLTVTAGAKGALQATVSFTAPTLSISDQPLTSITKIDVYRDDNLVKTFDKPAAGQQLSFEDTGLTNGKHTWRVIPSNEMGEGTAAEATAFVGVDQPGPVNNLRLNYDYTTGKSTLTWDAPIAGVNGGYINTEDITYSVTRIYQNEPTASGITNTVFEEEIGIDYLLEAQALKEQEYEGQGMTVVVDYVVNGQGAIRYDVCASNTLGTGTSTRSNIVIIGEQYTLPFAESFANGRYANFWRTDIRNSTSRWIPFYDKRFNQDDDNGMIGFNAIEGGETATLLSGNISMKGTVSPVMMFYYFTAETMTNPLLIKAVKNNGNLETIATIPLNEASKVGSWQYASIPLTGYSGHDYVQVAFETTMGTTVDVVYLDNIRIIDQKGKDLAAEIVSAPDILKVGETKFLTVAVENLGVSDAATNSYRVDAYVNHQLAGTAMGTAIKSGQTANVMVPLNATIDMAKQSELYAEVVYDADEATDNNVSEVLPVKVKMPNLPTATQLRAANNNGAVLNWNAPAAPRTEDGQVTDSFEEYEDFTTNNFGEWKLFDGDKGIVYGLDNYSFPVPGHIMAYIVFNPSQVDNLKTGGKGLSAEDGPSWQPRTGDKLLLSLSPQGASDDWLISPELSGNAQTISFYAHNHRLYQEQFQLYISTTGNETTNFVAFDQTPVKTTKDWQQYEYNLPQGTKYFAIRKVSNDTWGFMIDDVTFAPDTLASQAGAVFYGYNVYKNGIQLNTALVTTPSFTDADGKPGDTYRVTAVYNRGESAYSNEIVFTDDITAIHEIEGATTDTDDRYYDLQGRSIRDPSRVRGIIVGNKKKVIVK